MYCKAKNKIEFKFSKIWSEIWFFYLEDNNKTKILGSNLIIWNFAHEESRPIIIGFDVFSTKHIVYLNFKVSI